MNNPLLNSPLGLGLYTASGIVRYTPEHLIVIDEALLRLVNDEYDKLVICVPPRHGKSELVSLDFVHWYLLTFPEHRIILTSYADNLAQHFGRRARDRFESFPQISNGLHLDESSQSKGDWTLAGHIGGLRATGAGGSITGRGGNILLIDDIIKNREEALSATTQENLWEWFLSTLRTRKEPNGKEIIVGNRWQKNDFIGRYLKQIDGRTRVLVFPAIAKENDSLGRQPGEALFRERYNEEQLATIKREVGSFWWNSLYQQEPGDLEGSLFKRQYIKFFNLIPTQDAVYLEYIDADGTHRIDTKDCLWFATSDLNAEEGKDNDYFVLQIWLHYKGKLFLLDQLRSQVDVLLHEQLFKQFFIKHKKKPKMIGVERVAYQNTLAKSLRRSGLPIINLQPESNKKVRALPAAARLECGDMYFNADLPNREDLIEELCVFPNGDHDDMVDCVSYAVMMMIKYGTGLRISVDRGEKQ